MARYANRENYEYYQDDSGMCCVVGTTYSFGDAAGLLAWAEDHEYELAEVDPPEEINYDAPAW